MWMYSVISIQLQLKFSKFLLAELNLLKAQVRKNSLNIAQIIQSSLDLSRDHFVRTQP